MRQRVRLIELAVTQVPLDSGSQLCSRSRLFESAIEHNPRSNHAVALAALPELAVGWIGQLDMRTSFSGESFTADSNLIEALVKRSVPLACESGRTLFRKGEPANDLFLLQLGEAAVLLESRAGQTVISMHARSGALFGLPAVITRHPYSLTVIVSGGSEVRVTSREDFEQTLQEEPGLYASVMRILAAEVRFARLVLGEA
jgi:hypothetical protein